MVVGVAKLFSQGLNGFIGPKSMNGFFHICTIFRGARLISYNEYMKANRRLLETLREEYDVKEE